MEFPSKFNEDNRYIFTNWSNEDFIGVWSGAGTTIKAGATIELPEFKAYHYTKHFVDREMIKAGKEVLSGIDTEREPFEKKTMTLIDGTTESPALASLKAQIKAEMENGGKVAEPEKPIKKVDPSKEKTEFAAIK